MSFTLPWPVCAILLPFQCVYCRDPPPPLRERFGADRGVAAFYASDMPNTEAWLRQENFLLDSSVGQGGALASHLCS
jgi:hypothetical protein